MPVSGSVLLLYAGAHKISLKYLFPEKMFIEICCQKCQKCNTICVTTFFLLNFKGLSKKIIKYIHQNLKYYETIEQIHFMVVKIESYVWEKIVISDPLLYCRPLLLRQLKNNQNQTNTTEAQNLKEFNNTAGWLLVLIIKP
jgi:hypothetical protein